MSRQLEQALFSLIPTYPNDLPPSLVDLASSLLAQSRHRASTLKADEEIARLYACANIACNRLKLSLDLPPIVPRPPIPPRIYNRLYTHLDKALPAASASSRAGSARKRTPSLRARDGETSPTASARQLPSRGAPTKNTTLKQFQTSAARDTERTRALRQRREHDNELSDNLPVWMQPVIRFVCEESGQARLSPTTLAGMEYIVAPGGRRTKDEWVTENLTSLLAAVHFFVFMRAKAIESREAVDRENYVPQRKEIISLLDRARKEATIKTTVGDEGGAWSGWSGVKAREFDAAVAMINERGWLENDWYRGIEDVLKTQKLGVNGMLAEEDVDATSISRAGRADSMYNTKFDYLSEERCKGYAIWKADMLERISQAMSGGTAMEIDTQS